MGDNQLVLFDVVEFRPEKKPRRVRISGGWELTDHSCRHCMGRVLKRTNPDGTVVVRCAECGHSTAGEESAICWCGESIRGHGSVFECIRNPAKSDAAPQEVLVREKPVVKAAVRAPDRIYNPAFIGGE